MEIPWRKDSLKETAFEHGFHKMMKRNSLYKGEQTLGLYVLGAPNDYWDGRRL
jgi:hypothetical protein